MMTDLVRTQVLLKREQRRYLATQASKQDHSLSEILREMIDDQMRRQKFSEMHRVAELLKADYQAGGDLTDTTALDGEDFSDVEG
jgi:hypothetical protein